MVDSNNTARIEGFLSKYHHLCLTYCFFVSPYFISHNMSPLLLFKRLTGKLSSYNDDVLCIFLQYLWCLLTYIKKLVSDFREM